jgi:hypothetical protein
MLKLFPFLIVMFIVVFSAGFLSGYFIERTGMLYSESQIRDLRNDVENMQIQELFVAGKQVDCNLMASTMGSHSYHLWDLVNKLKTSRPETQEFYDLKRQADFLSLRAWIFANNIKQNCWGDVLPVLYIYSVNCPDCEEQDTILQSMKNDHRGVFVYAIDYYLDEPSIKLVRDAYNITSTPSMIINNQLFGKLEREELEEVVCGNIAC